MLTDLRLAVRRLLRAPGFAAAAVLTLALGLGANTTMFSLVSAVFLRPLAVQAPERLARVMTTWRGPDGRALPNVRAATMHAIVPPSGNGMSQTVRLPARGAAEPPTQYDVVAVVRDARTGDLTRPPEPMLYLPLAQRWESPMSLEVCVAAVGLAGVVAFAVAQRTREMGVRLALGAGRADVERLVVGEGMRLAVLGVAAGLALAAGVARLLASPLYGVGAGDPATYLLVAAALSTVALLAAWLPARRAARVDPLVALRAD